MSAIPIASVTYACTGRSAKAAHAGLGVTLTIRKRELVAAA